MENITGTPNTASVETSSEPIVDQGSTENNATESKLSGENDPNESFSDWLKREQAKNKAKETEKVTSEKSKEEKPRVDKVVAKEPEDSNAKVTKEPENSNSKVAKSESEAEKAPEQVLKVGEKTYKSEDIEKLVKDSTETSTKLETVTNQLKDLVNIIKTKPGEVLDRLEVPREVIEEYYYKKYMEWETLTDAQRVEKLQNEKKEREDNENKAKAEAAEKARVERNREYWSNVIKNSLQTEGVPENEWTIQRMAGYIRQSQEKSLNVPHNEIAKMVKEDLYNAQREAFKGMSPEQLIEAIGEEAAAKFRQHETEKFKQTKFEQKPAQTTSEPKPKKPGKRYSNVYQILDE